MYDYPETTSTYVQPDEHSVSQWARPRACPACLTDPLVCGNNYRMVEIYGVSASLLVGLDASILNTKWCPREVRSAATLLAVGIALNTVCLLTLEHLEVLENTAVPP